MRWLGCAVGAMVFGAVGDAAAERPWRCLTPQLIATKPLPVRPVLPPGLKAGTKEVRDAHPGIPNVVTSENFALKWGSEGEITPEEAGAILEVFEEAWRVEVEVMEHPAPWGTDAYLLNLYIGDTGPEVPSAGAAEGYYYLDDEGWPMIVIAESLAHDAGRLAGTVAAHELYHAIQDGTQRFALTDPDVIWYREATAEWITGEVFEDSPYFGSLLFGYAFLPHLALDTYLPPANGDLEEYHAYGAFIWLRFLSEQVADWRLIRDTWLDRSAITDPLEVLVAQLAARDVDATESFLDFAVHNATWDYAHHDLFAANVEHWREVLPAQDLSGVAITEVWGSGSWLRPPNATLPESWGANTILLRPVASGRLTVEVLPDEEGSDGGAGEIRAALVRHHAGGASQAVELSDDGESLSTTTVVAEEDLAVYLVVTVTSSDRQAGEVFGYQYRTQVETLDGEPLPPPPGGCAAILPVSGTVGLLISLFGVFLARRRKCVATG